LIAYLIGNISAQKYQNLFTFANVIASQRWDVFETRCTLSRYNSDNVVNRFWQFFGTHCSWESMQSKCVLFYHLTQLVLLHYLAKWRNTK